MKTCKTLQYFWLNSAKRSLLYFAEWWQTCNWPYLPTCLVCRCSCWLCYITMLLSITPRSRSEVWRRECNFCCLKWHSPHPYILHLIQKLQYVSLQTYFQCLMHANPVNIFFLQQVRWDSHHHGNNIPVFHNSFQQLNIYVKLHSYDFFLIKICELYLMNTVIF